MSYLQLNLPEGSITKVRVEGERKYSTFKRKERTQRKIQKSWPFIVKKKTLEYRYVEVGYDVVDYHWFSTPEELIKFLAHFKNFQDRIVKVKEDGEVQYWEKPEIKVWYKNGKNIYDIVETFDTLEDAIAYAESLESVTGPMIKLIFDGDERFIDHTSHI